MSCFSHVSQLLIKHSVHPHVQAVAAAWCLCSATRSLLRSSWKETYRAQWSTFSRSKVFTEFSVTERTKALRGSQRLSSVPSQNHQCAYLLGVSAGTRKQYRKSPRCCWVLRPPGDSEKWEADVNQHVGATGMPRHHERLKSEEPLSGKKSYSKRSYGETQTV